MISDLSDGSGVAGRVAIVTGGSGSIGSAVVDALRRDGAITTGVDLVPPRPGDDGTETLPAHLEVDVVDAARTKAAVDAVADENGRVDIVVAAAGVAANTDLEELDADEFHRIVDVNLLGLVNVMRAAVPHMRRQGYGKIVALGSVAARIGGVKSGPHYVAAKAGVHGVVKWAAKRYGPDGIFVNSVAPGPVLTPMWDGLNEGQRVEAADGHPLGRLGRPEDIAEPVVFLAGAGSNWITGETLDINGGMYMS